LKKGKKEASTSNAPGTEPAVPHISTCVAVSDFEAHAKAVLSNKSWIYASSSANSGHSMKGNIDDWSLVTFRPRVLRRVEQVDTQTSILGHKTQFPFYASPMGTMGSINTGAEPELVRGAVSKGVHAVVSTASTKTNEQIMQSLVDEQQLLDNRSRSRLFFQFYINVDRHKATDLLRRVKKAGYKGLWITVDTPILGKRLADRRLQAQEALEVGLEEEKSREGPENSFAPASGGRPVPGALSPNTTWEDLVWIREEWDGPIVLKGIQCAEDAKLAVEHGCQGILLSNHGGRQMHSAPSALTTLLEIRTYYPEVLDKIEIFVDGGVRDGGDVLKALCLGATGVGIGRPLLYALAAYGSDGVERCIDSKSSCIWFVHYSPFLLLMQGQFYRRSFLSP
jgi:L-lactate dehydrogenase (cytochrome)